MSTRLACGARRVRFDRLDCLTPQLNGGVRSSGAKAAATLLHHLGRASAPTPGAIKASPRRMAFTDARADTLATPAAAGGALGHAAVIPAPSGGAFAAVWPNTASILASAVTDCREAFRSTPSGRTLASIRSEAYAIAGSGRAVCRSARWLAAVRSSPSRLTGAYIRLVTLAVAAAVIATDGTITRWPRVAILTLARLSVAVAGTVAGAILRTADGDRAVGASPAFGADATTARIAVATS